MIKKILKKSLIKSQEATRENITNIFSITDEFAHVLKWTMERDDNYISCDMDPNNLLALLENIKADNIIMWENNNRIKFDTWKTIKIYCNGKIVEFIKPNREQIRLD